MINKEGNCFIGLNSTKTDEKRPKPVFFWNNADVMKWLKRVCEEYYGLYGQLFLEHEITGRSLVRVTELTLQRMGITDPRHCDDICRIILKLKLKSDLLEMKDLERKTEYSELSDYFIQLLNLITIVNIFNYKRLFYVIKMDGLADELIRYGLGIGAVFQLMCIFAVIFISSPKNDNNLNDFQDDSNHSNHHFHKQSHHGKRNRHEKKRK